ncbi:MAG: orotate phosphoribosyltransferase [Ignavibacteria bacterium]|nr:orotate phosphoribosyltransferase [Ignavibacteria bacterium]
MTEQDKLKIFKDTGALLEGHFLLSSGLHSNIYFQCAKVLQYPEFMTLFCEEIADFYKNYDIDVVISPALGGIIVGQEVGRLLVKRTIFAERVDNELTLRRGFFIEKGENVLICEDVVTTAKSSLEVASIVNKYEGNIVGIGAIVDRSSSPINLQYPLFSTMKISVENYQPTNCPLCKNGLVIDKPGSRNII